MNSSVTPEAADSVTSSFPEGQPAATRGGNPQRRAPFLVEPWVLCFSLFNCAGWLLSMVHMVNAVGYALVSLLGVLLLALWKNKIHFGQVRIRRFKRFLPGAFLVLAVLTLLGGVLHAPTNYDAIAYRTPRVLQWLAEGKWFWIHTSDLRQNTRTCGLEWITAPLLALTRSDRGFFIANWLSFLILPGLVFRVFKRMGVRPRVAWQWMWIAPTGYCFLLEAGSICNDLLGAPFALAACEAAFATHDPENESHAHRYFWLSLLACASLTAVKASNVLLLLAPGVLLLPKLHLLLRRKGIAVAVLAVSLLASLFPTAAINWSRSGEWTGKEIEKSTWPPMPEASVPLRICANAAITAVPNVLPPLFPFVAWWRNKCLPAIVPHPLARILCPKAPDGTLESGPASTQQMAHEEEAGLGLGIVSMLAVSILMGGLPRPRKRSLLDWLALGSPYVSLAVFLASAFFISSLARIIAPFYLLLLPPLLQGRHLERFYAGRTWRFWTMANFVVALALVVASPSRPLWPAQTVVAAIEKRMRHNAAVQRIKNVYSVYSERSNSYGPVLAVLPPAVRVIGFVGFSSPEGALWLPYGSRRVFHVLPQDSRESIVENKISYILANELISGGPEKFLKWKEKLHAEIVHTFMLNLRASEGLSKWYLVRLGP